MTITPDQALELLDGATTGPWDIRETDALMGGRAFNLRQSGKPGIRVSATTYGHNDDPELIAAAPDLAQTIAGMEWQWSVERLTEDGSRWLIDRPWTCDRELAETWLRKYDGSRLVRRLVGPVEVAE